MTEILLKVALNTITPPHINDYLKQRAVCYIYLTHDGQHSTNINKVYYEQLTLTVNL